MLTANNSSINYNNNDKKVIMIKISAVHLRNLANKTQGKVCIDNAAAGQCFPYYTTPPPSNGRLCGLHHQWLASVAIIADVTAHNGSYYNYY